MSGFAPFVGAGIGWAGNQMKEVVTEDGGAFLRIGIPAEPVQPPDDQYRFARESSPH